MRIAAAVMLALLSGCSIYRTVERVTLPIGPTRHLANEGK